jgi:O-antigen ligase
MYAYARSMSFFTRQCLSSIALLVAQLVPWPQVLRPGLVTTTPELAPLIAFAAPGWNGFSVTPAARWAATTSMIPFLAVFLGVSKVDMEGRSKLASLVIGLGALALLVGFIQVFQGAHSDLRFFEFTNPSEPVGFFANRNHFAAQLYTTLVCAGIWFASSVSALFTARKFNSQAILRVVTFAILVVAVLAGLTVARSRAGLFLSIAAISGVAVMFVAGRRRTDRQHGHSAHLVQHLVLSGLVFAVLFSAQFGIHRVLTRFEVDPLDDFRVTLSPATFELALDSTPFGTGLGSFPTVYANGEKRQHLFSGYANRAHNDWAEFLLEAGIFSVGIGGLFLAWLARHAIHIWAQKSAQSVDHHLMLQRGATLVIILLLAHSLVDYPLRTTSISVLFAFSCALLVRTPPNLEHSTTDKTYKSIIV